MIGNSIGNSIGHCEVLSKLGEGGMGEVYRARDAKLDRTVAIKILPEAFATDTERIARFRREAKTLASVNHMRLLKESALQIRKGFLSRPRGKHRRH
jgi:serine/threonine protein kinase